MDNEVPIQSAAWRGGRAGTGFASANLSGSGSGDHPRCCIAGSYPHAGIFAGALGAGEAGAVSEGAVVAQAAGRVSAPAETLLGTAPVGTRLLLRDGGRGG